VATVRSRLVDPVPQEVEHVAHGIQAATAQSAKHAAVVHDCDAVSSGQAAPPFEALPRRFRFRDWLPGPHVVEHAAHAAHEPTEQSVGQLFELHGSDCVSASHTPVCVCVRARARVRVFACVRVGVCMCTRTRKCACAGASVPVPLAELINVRARLRVPLPHVNEHDDHAAQSPNVQSRLQVTPV
jgi:hypothetical protein